MGNRTTNHGLQALSWDVKLVIGKERVSRLASQLGVKGTQSFARFHDVL